MSTIEIRRQEPDDASDLHDVYSQPNVIRGTLQLPHPSLHAWQTRGAEEPKGMIRLVACMDERVVGNIAMWTMTSSRRRHAGQFGMAVHDDWQGKGCGFALLQAVLDFADNWMDLRRIELEVFQTTNPGGAFTKAADSRLKELSDNSRSVKASTQMYTRWRDYAESTVDPRSGGSWQKAPTCNAQREVCYVPMTLSRIIFFLWLGLILSSCDETASEPESDAAAQSKDVGFEAVITGSYEGEVSGLGAFVFLPEGGFEKLGYFFLSDGQGLRPHGVTFVLPRGLAPGKHDVESPSPLDIGTVVSVRVDRDIGDSVLSFETNTSGFLDLIAMPDDETSVSGSEVVGSFQVETEDWTGAKITVKGKFSFKAK